MGGGGDRTRFPAWVTDQMRILDLFQDNRPIFSFEFFPPKTADGLANLFNTLYELAPLRPSFVSVTYGAGGSTRDLTLELVGRIKTEVNLEAMAHLTCVGHTADELTLILDQIAASGVENVLALRGDPPKGSSRFEKTEGGFGYASELIAFIRERYPFCLGAACYPEGHVECPDHDVDLNNLRRKVDAGADFLISQLFFEADTFFRFRDRAVQAGIQSPMIPGIMPVTNVAQLERFTSLCGASIPPALASRLAEIREDEAAVVEAGIDWSTDQCARLLEGGAPGVHFYTLNRSHSTRHVHERLVARLQG